MSLINPADSLERQNEKLLQISEALMRRVEQKNEHSGFAYQQFERAALLETQVRERTRELERTLDLLQDSNARLELANIETRTAQSNLSEAIETIREGFALFDSEDRLVLFNSRFCRDLFDVVPELQSGLSFEDYVTMVSKSRCLALPDGEKSGDWFADRLAHHREPHVVFNVSLNWDRWLQVSEHRTSNGGTVILQTDVTEIFRMEREERDKIRNQQARMLQATLDHLNQGVCIFDREGMLVGWNTRMSRMFDIVPQTGNSDRRFETLFNQLCNEVEFDTGFSANILKTWATRGQGRSPIAFEVTHKRDKIYSIFAQEMPDHGFVISFTDVTTERSSALALSQINEKLEQRVFERTAELGEALAEAERANASKSRFVAAASHDLLQPLSAAKLFVSSILDQTGRDDVREIVDKTETALQGVEQIIEALLAISKLDAGKAVFDVQALPLSNILNPLRDELTPIAEAKGVELRIVESSLTVKSDPGYLRRILQNLLSNAIRYTERGRVLMGVRRVGTSARIEVWDTGCGIPPADQELIFQEFKQLSSGPGNSSQRNSGLGLGLAIVERACKGLGHPFELWSEPGVGSCFSLLVPVEGAAPARFEPPGLAGLSAAKRLDGLLVLLVENSSNLAYALSHLIEGYGAEVITAADAEEALSIIREIDLLPDAFLFDYRLGDGMSGIELFKEITAVFGAVPTAIVTADRTLELRRHCSDLGLRLISKPVDADRIYSFLNSSVPACQD